MKFIDTNVFVYAADSKNPTKRSIARDGDSLLIASAAEIGCDEFISEDLNDGQIYCGMRAVNPFKAVG